MRGGFSRCISPGPGDTRRCSSISEEPQSLSHRRFIQIFPFYGGYFHLFLVIQKNNYVNFTQTSELWLFTIIHIYNVTRKAIISLQVVLLALKSSILREVSACPRDPKAVLFRIGKFVLEAVSRSIYIFISVGLTSKKMYHKVQSWTLYFLMFLLMKFVIL